MIKLSKQTYNDIRSQIENKLDGYVYDLDDQYAYFSKGEWEDDRYTSKTYRIPYNVSGGVVSLEEDSTEEVVKNTEYTPVIKVIEKLSSYFGSSNVEVPIIKQFDEKNNTVIEPLYIAYGEVDGHGDTYKDEDAVHQLVKEFNDHKDTMQKAISHRHKTDCFDIVKAWVIEEESMLGDQKVPRLQPVVELKYSDKAFELRKEGKLLGPSIGCSAKEAELIKSLLDEIKSEGKSAVEAKRTLAGFDFSKKFSHLSLTTPSGGGPASLKEWMVVLEKGMQLNKEDSQLLEELEEEFTPLEKKLKADGGDSKETAPSTPVDAGAQDAGVDNKTVNKGQDEMSEALQKEIAELKKQLEAERVEKDLSKYSLEKEVSTELSKALVELSEDHRDAVIKSLDAVVAAGEAKAEELSKEKEEVAAELEKAKEGTQEDNELAKQLADEKGHPEIEKSQGEKTFGERVAASMKKNK